MSIFFFINSENLFKRTTDLLVSEGYADAGYEYVIIDDCWLEKNRDNVTGRLVEDRERFPSGLNDLANYVGLMNLFAFVLSKNLIFIKLFVDSSKRCQVWFISGLWHQYLCRISWCD